jgi:adenine-specific DNA glycosylase
MMPNLAPRPAILQKRVMAFVVERREKFLVRQRPSGVVNAHLWEFPNHEITSAGVGEPEHFRIRSDKPLCTIKHSITRHRITLEAWPAILAPGKTADAAARWLTLVQLRNLPFTSAHKKILMALRGSR